MGEPTSLETTDLQALERFVVDNDDLLELEARIGRFNIFDALGVARAEIRHSNFLAWLLDPNESHGQGALFLKAVLADLLRQAPRELRPLSPVELDGEELRGVEIRREWRNIDLLVTCKEPPFVIAIENKVDSGEHSDQLRRYEDIIRQKFPGQTAMFVFLTANGGEASDDDWVPYNYTDIYRVLTRCRAGNAGTIGGDVAAFLDHYLRLIGSRFMPERETDELCRRIYRNHRRAIDLIKERCGSFRADLLLEAKKLLEQQSDRWEITWETSKLIEIHLKSLDASIPRLPDEDSKEIPWPILRPKLCFEENSCWWEVWIAPLLDKELRQKIVERLRENPAEFELRSRIRKDDAKYTLLGWDYIAQWDGKTEPNLNEIISTIRKYLDVLESRFAKLPATLGPIFVDRKNE